MDKNVSTRRLGGAGAVAAMAVALMAGCGSGRSGPPAASPPAAAVRSFVGTAQGTTAFVSVVVDGSRALAYICDGVPGDPAGTTPTVQAWFNGASDGTTVDVQQPAGRLQLQLTSTGMTGTVSLADGRRLAVSGQAAAADAGLYRAESTGAGGKVVAGWILAADGQQRGGFGVENGGTTKLSAVRPLTLSQPVFSVQGIATARIAKVGITPIPIP